MEPKFFLSPRLQMLIEIALHADCDCADTLQEQDERARDIGLVGVEIDAARRHTSFDVHALAAIRLACAIRQGNTNATRRAESQALGVGLSQADIRELKAFLASSP